MLTNGTNYQIDWPAFKPGTSIFIPAVDTKSALVAIKKESERLEFEYAHKIVVEDGVKSFSISANRFNSSALYLESTKGLSLLMSLN